ncbi:hypothetical protein CBI38_24630 [Rhodococcus oxybenzonivorans]|uniref:Helix-turn-helix domain-containing protein n=1 Tax=Rhodococcus oxybenzonivorans TaxID=1990687 RepID=A0A2S2C0D2_9NOCA|nr:excisionase family DNA-binding protein [Rhodococcus oxybenzonivorans]AWK74264.1 hypothetical protein CBI38_24630 [Rhodococcus oxybenzonivorans]
MQNKLNTITETLDRVAVSRSKLYELMDAGDIRSVKVGKRRLISDAAINDWIAGLEAKSGNAA